MAEVASPDLSVREKVQALIANARATLSPDGTTATIETTEEPPTTPEELEFPVVEPVEPELEEGEEAPALEGEEVVEPVEETTDHRTVIVPKGEGEVRMTFRTVEEADVIRQLQRSARSSDQVMRQQEQVRSQQDELDQFRDLLEIDRSGIILEMVPPDAKRELLTQLLLEDGVLEDEALNNAIDNWRDNAEARRAARLEIENARFKSRSQLDGQYAAKRAIRDTARTTLDTTVTVADQFLTDPVMREAFIDDMVADVKTWANSFQREHGHLPRLTPEHVLQITARRLSVYRIDLDDAKRALDPNTATPPKARPKGVKAERIAAAAREARATGARFTTAAQQRKVASLVPGSGVTGTPAEEGMTPPTGQTWKERSGWIREKLGLKR
jgi:hypothetical protein